MPAPPSLAPTSNGDNAPANGPPNGVGAVGGAELAADRGDVKLDRLIADPEAGGNHLVGQPFDQQLDDLQSHVASAVRSRPSRW